MCIRDRDGLRQLQALHRFGEQAPARFIKALFEYRSIADATQAFVEQCIHRSLDQVTAQAFL